MPGGGDADDGFGIPIAIYPGSNRSRMSIDIFMKKMKK
jgi:hypothetical protein